MTSPVPNQLFSLLAVFAHPDDETFRCGGTLALLARRGVRVWVLCATRGEAGVADMDPQQAGQIRQAELQCACRALGIQPPRFLSYQDGTLSQVDDAEAVAQIAAVARELRPHVLLTWPPDGLSGHPDHICVSRWTAQAFQQATGWEAESPAALYHLAVPQSVAQALGLAQLHAVPDDQITLAVDVTVVWEQKMAAICCHRTQAGSTPILRASEERQRLFLGKEHFRRAQARIKHDMFEQTLLSIRGQ